jgi:hypothetical protein
MQLAERGTGLSMQLSVAKEKAAGIVLPLILLLSSSAGMVGCTQTLKTPAPPRPVLESIRTNDRGGICLDHEDTTELLNYLDTLEHSECYY